LTYSDLELLTLIFNLLTVQVFGTCPKHYHQVWRRHHHSFVSGGGVVAHFMPGVGREEWYL